MGGVRFRYHTEIQLSQKCRKCEQAYLILLLLYRHLIKVYECYKLTLHFALNNGHANKVESCLKYLQEVLPEWIKCIEVSTGVFIKVDKSIDLKTMMKKLEKEKLALSIHTVNS